MKFKSRSNFDVAFASRYCRTRFFLLTFQPDGRTLEHQWTTRSLMVSSISLKVDFKSRSNFDVAFARINCRENVSAWLRYYWPSVKTEDCNGVIDFAQSRKSRSSFDFAFPCRSCLARVFSFEWKRFSMMAVLFTKIKPRGVEWCIRFCSKWTLSHCTYL